ncbi:MAG: hypothetical protein PHQ27_00650 [Victivallales bacterium]|nr:hypothetical protein [Victivallales bacterium]
MSAKFIKRSSKSNKDEQGVALILTLGILSLLLVLALSFASNSIVERKVAFNTNSRTQARLIAKSGLNRAVMAVEYYLSDLNSYDNNVFLNNLFSRVSGGGDVDGLNKLSTTTDSTVIFQYNNGNPVRWQYLSNGDSSDPRLLGRFAYVVIPDTGKIDPSAIVDTGFGVESDPLAEGNTGKRRPGRLVSEIYMAGVDAIFTSANADLMSHTNVYSGGKLPAKTRWLCFEQMFSSKYLNINAAIDAVVRDRLRQKFMLYNPPDIEAYWAVDGSVNQKKMADMRHRFNLYRDDWNSMSVDHLLCSDTTPAEFSAGAASTNCIQYLTKICAVPATFATIAARRSQIAANILDYSDNDAIPTSDVSPASWDNTNIPTYTGNEKTLYINELRAAVSGSLAISDLGGGMSSVVTTLDIRPSAELINIYDSTTSNLSDYSLKIYGEITCTYSLGGAAVPQTLPFNTAINGTINGTDWSGSGGYHTGTASTTVSVTFPALTGPNTSSGTAAAYAITDIKLKIYCAVLSLSGNNVDYARPDREGRASGTLYDLGGIPDMGTINIPVMQYFATETDDPRQNLNSGDWSTMAANATETAIGSPGTVNSTVTMNAANKDPEPQCGNDPAYRTSSLSTAYIRDARMESPWELGCIHRGAAWETINLKKFNDKISYKYNSTDLGTTDVNATYANGDAGILDQVKMTAETRTYGLVDLNMSNSDILNALTYNIPINPNYSDPGAQVNLYTIPGVAEEIARKTTLYRHRAQMASAIATAYSTPSTDAEKEAIIGKTVCLTKAFEAPDEFKIIVVGQAIQDLGGGMNITKNINGTNQSATVNYNHYEANYDQITGEQKMLVTVSRNPLNNKLKIEKIEYLQD